MKCIVTQSHEESCALAAARFAEVIRQKPDAKIGLATGSTPLPLYANLVRMYEAGELDFSRVRSVNLDEYSGLGPEHPQSYRYFMRENLFSRINIEPENTYVASGLGDPEAAAKRLDAKVAEGGPPDIQLLGIGNNGHIAFNEAGDSLMAPSHVVTLSSSTIQANARFFESDMDVPRHAITMGMQGILSAKDILLLATGPQKADAIRGLLEDGRITPRNPATFLKLHTNVTVYIDRELAALADYRAE